MVERIKVPDSFYIGVRVDSFHTSTPTPIAMMVPYSTDKRFEQRKASVDDWLGYGQGSPYVKTFGSFILENEPLYGFALNTSKASNGMCGYYSVRDPRGFDIGIAIDNARDLLRTCTIDHGEIMAQCVYGRNGANMVLLPVDSPTYREAVTYTTLQEKRVSIRDIAAGNRVHLKNGLEATYLGFLYPIVHADDGFLFVERRSHHFRVVDREANGLHIVRTAMISKILDHSVMTPAEAEAVIGEEDWRMQQVRDQRVRLPYQYLTSMANPMSMKNIEIAFEPTNRYAIRDSYCPGCSYSVIGSNDSAHFYRTTAYHFARDDKATDVECNRVDPDAIRQQGIFRHYPKPAPLMPPHSRLIATLFGNDVERKTLDFNMTDWYFVCATLTNPQTGAAISVKLSN